MSSVDPRYKRERETDFCVAFVGEGCVGKTSIIRRYLHDNLLTFEGTIFDYFYVDVDVDDETSAVKILGLLYYFLLVTAAI